MLVRISRVLFSATEPVADERVIRDRFNFDIRVPHVRTATLGRDDLVTWGVVGVLGTLIVHQQETYVLLANQPMRRFVPNIWPTKQQSRATRPPELVIYGVFTLSHKVREVDEKEALRRFRTGTATLGSQLSFVMYDTPGWAKTPLDLQEPTDRVFLLQVVVCDADRKCGVWVSRDGNVPLYVVMAPYVRADMAHVVTDAIHPRLLPFPLEHIWTLTQSGLGQVTATS